MESTRVEAYYMDERGEWTWYGGGRFELLEEDLEEHVKGIIYEEYITKGHGWRKWKVQYKYGRYYAQRISEHMENATTFYFEIKNDEELMAWKLKL